MLPAVHGANMDSDFRESVVKRVVIAALLLVACVAPAWADFKEGVAANDRGDYATALRVFRPAAAGDAGADQGDVATASAIRMAPTEIHGDRAGLHGARPDDRCNERLLHEARQGADRMRTAGGELAALARVYREDPEHTHESTVFVS